MQVVASRLGGVSTADELELALRAMMLDGAGTARRLKTFIAELDGDGALGSRRGDPGWDVRPTGLAGVSTVAQRGAGAPACELVMDRRWGRFCMIHTAAADSEAEAAVSLLANTTKLSRAWVCPSVLEGLASSARNGADTRGMVRMSREDAGGRATADVRSDGAVAHSGGTSVGAHMLIAGAVRDAYARMCENAERFRLGTVDTPDGQRIDLQAIDMMFSREVDDVPGFIDRVFDGKPPLMMRGEKIHVEGDHYHVPTANMVEMHYMGIDVTPQLLCVGLHHGCSASGVLRLLARLQLRHDHMLACEQITAGVCSA